MSNNNNNFDKIDDFIMGKLESEELKSFEFELSNNDALSAAVTQQRKLFDGIRNAGRREFVADLKVIHEKVVTEKKRTAKIINFNWRQLLVVASTMCILLVSWWLFTDTSSDAQSIFADNYEPFALNQNLRNFGQEEEMIQAAEYYRNKNYNESLPLLQKIDSNESSSSIKMAIAISYFENKDTEKALEILNDIIVSKDPFLSDLAHWYSALFKLQNRQNEEAKSHLEYLSSSLDKDKHLDAKKILEKLR